MSLSRHQLPPMAAEYVTNLTADKHIVGQLVGRFHGWLETEQITIAEINTSNIDQFLLQPWARELAESPQSLYDSHLNRYVGWLASRGLTQSVTKATTSPLLPETARAYIQELQATHRPNTCRSYRCSLDCWFRWAGSKHISIREVTRKDIVAYCRMLHERKLAPATRCLRLSALRRYLFFLDDQGLLANKPARLIRPVDFPKLPMLLPRALPPNIDTEICTRLTKSHDIKCRGFLLMRHTGIRVSELRELPFDCMREDYQGHVYLKVPLGKLNSERLVPIDTGTSALVRAIQEQGRQGRSLLIENPSRQKPYSLVSYHRSFRLIRAGLETSDGIEITTHRLRHTFAAEMLNAGLSLASIQQLLGHRSMTMTLRYVRLTPNRLREDFLKANAKARKRYGAVPEVPTGTTKDANATPSSVAADLARCVKRDAATLSDEAKAQAQRVARQLKNLGIRLRDLGL